MKIPEMKKRFAEALRLEHGLWTEQELQQSIAEKLAALEAADPPMSRDELIVAVASLLAYQELTYDRMVQASRMASETGALIVEDVSARSHQGKKAAIASHKVNIVDGMTVPERLAKAREEWASGKYPSRDDCARDIYKRLGLGVSTVRRALANTPDLA